MSAARRLELERATPAELAIDAAIAEVEKLPPDGRLTAAILLLEKARKRVADFLDGEPGSPLVDALR